MVIIILPIMRSSPVRSVNRTAMEWTEEPGRLTTTVRSLRSSNHQIPPTLYLPQIGIRWPSRNPITSLGSMYGLITD